MDYTVVKSGRRTLAVQIKTDGSVVVRAPFRTADSRIAAFIDEKSAWIEKHLKEIRAAQILPKYDENEIKAFVAAAKRVLPEKAARFASVIGVSFKRVTIRKARTLWGSCTVKGNINLNCLLVCLPEKAADYIVIHELCHLRYMNHSRKFWAFVEKFCPDYKSVRKWLRQNGGKYLSRL